MSPDPEEGAEVPQTETEAREILSKAEPPYASAERATHLIARSAGMVQLRPSDPESGSLMTSEEWRARWRAMPDHDKGPVKRGSGPVIALGSRWSRPDFGVIEEGSRDDEPWNWFDIEIYYRDLQRKFGEESEPRASGELKAIRERAKKRRQREEQKPNSYHFKSSLDGGRGWCKGLLGKKRYL